MVISIPLSVMAAPAVRLVVVMAEAWETPTSPEHPHGLRIVGSVCPVLAVQYVGEEEDEPHPEEPYVAVFLKEPGHITSTDRLHRMVDWTICACPWHHSEDEARLKVYVDEQVLTVTQRIEEMAERGEVPRPGYEGMRPDSAAPAEQPRRRRGRPRKRPDDAPGSSQP